MVLIRGVDRRSGTPSRFDASFYRTHDPLGYIPSDVRSLKSQATYSSGLPSFTTSTTGPFGAAAPGAKRSTFGSYASSIVSQDPVTSSATDSSSVAGSAVPADRASQVAFSQSDRINRRLSVSSAAGLSDLGTVSTVDYKSQDDAADLDDVKSQYSGTQAGVTVF